MSPPSRLHRSPGLTLAEVLVTAAILALLGVLLTRIYDVSRTAYATGVGRLGLQQRARQVVQRVSTRLVQAVPPSDAQAAIVSPAPLAPPASQVVYNLPGEPFDPRAPTYRVRRIFFTQATGVVASDPNTPLDPTDDTAEVLGRDIDWLGFEVLSQNAVRVTVRVKGEVRGATNRTREQDFGLQTVVQIPFYATR